MNNPIWRYLVFLYCPARECIFVARR